MRPQVSLPLPYLEHLVLGAFALGSYLTHCRRIPYVVAWLRLNN